MSLCGHTEMRTFLDGQILQDCNTHLQVTYLLLPISIFAMDLGSKTLLLSTHPLLPLLGWWKLTLFKIPDTHLGVLFPLYYYSKFSQTCSGKSLGA